MQRKHLKHAVNLKWAFIISTKMYRKEFQTPTKEEENDSWNYIAFPYVTGLSENFFFYSSMYLLQHRNWFIPKPKQTNTIVHAMQCSEECFDRYFSHSTKAWHNIGEPPQHDKTRVYTCALRTKGVLLWTPMFTFSTRKTGWFLRTNIVEVK